MINRENHSKITDARYILLVNSTEPEPTNVEKSGDGNPNITKQPDNIMNPQHLLDYLNFPKTLEPFDFDKCQMSNCFDFSLCKPYGGLRVYIVPSRYGEQSYINSTGESNIIHRNIIKIIKESNYYENDPTKACLFVLEDDTLDRDPLSPSFRQELQSELIGADNFYGLNHIVFNLYSGTWPDYEENDFSGIKFGAAIIAKASNSLNLHRRNFDISLPLFSYQHPTEEPANLLTDDDINRLSVQNRSYFLTFKGKRYVIGSGSKTRNSLYHLNNNRDVILLTTCRHGKRWRESSDPRCSEDESIYDQYDFVNLIRDSTFCLVPRGRRLGSFRFLEALSYGCIPVIMSDGWVNPFDEIIDWSSAIIQYKEELLLLVPDMLRDFDTGTIIGMRKNCYELYRRYFSTTKRIILSTLDIIDRRVNDYFLEHQ